MAVGDHLWLITLKLCKYSMKLISPLEHVTVMWGEFGLLLREKHFLSKVEVVDESDGVRVELRILRTEQGALMDIFNWSMLRRAQ